MTTILEDRLARLLAPDFHLRRGSGNGINGAVDACIMQAVDWLAGGDGRTDHPKCASVKITEYCIRLNDSPLFKDHRDMLKPYAAKIVGTAGPSGPREVRRAYCLADYAIRKFAPLWLRADPKQRFNEWADKLEACEPITSEETRKAARAIARAAAYAASAASAASAAYAADAGDAASAASAADAGDAASAASAASAADAADAASAAQTKVLADKGDELRALSLECLDAVLAIA